MRKETKKATTMIVILLILTIMNTINLISDIYIINTINKINQKPVTINETKTNEIKSDQNINSLGFKLGDEVRYTDQTNKLVGVYNVCDHMIVIGIHKIRSDYAIWVKLDKCYFYDGTYLPSTSAVFKAKNLIKVGK